MHRLNHRASTLFRRLRNYTPPALVITLFTLVFLFSLLLFLAIALDSCQRKEGVQAKPHWFKHYQHFKEKDYVQFIEGQINSETDTLLMPSLVRDFYRERNFHPFWTQKGLQEAMTDSLLSSLTNAYPNHGIPGEYFYLDSIQQTIKQLMEHEVPDNEALYPHLYRIERLLTDQYLRYACALEYGAVNPKRVHGNKWYYETLVPDSAFLLNALDSIALFSEYLTSHAPEASEYQKLQKELKHWCTMSDTTIVAIPDFRMRKDAQNDNLAALCKRLNQLGFQTKSSNTLNDNILASINSFRRQHGIPESDSLDTETIEKLNRPIQHYIDALSANMERLRWKKSHQKSDDTLYIAVNIPDYMLCVVQQDSVVMRNRICCGRTQNPENVPARHKGGLVIPYKAETPLMYSRIRTLMLNPEWNIPYDIIKDEYYHKLVKSNTAVVNREHLYIRDGRNGQYVIPDSINWSLVNRGNIPYRLYQTSGRYNALGLYKFVFSNSESVYLHDTNNKGAFKRRKRALSHGCVRVQNPDSVAEWVYRVNNFDTNYIEQLHIISGAEPTTEKGEEFVEKLHEKDSIYYEKLSDWDKQFYRKLRPTSVALRKPIPLFIEYYTCFPGPDNTVHYRDDVYYKDGNILYLMKNPE
jgi:murein L,D-transpeptidase YcbB/YkuD